jgi:hypothetical protein
MLEDEENQQLIVDLKIPDFHVIIRNISSKYVLQIIPCEYLEDKIDKAVIPREKSIILEITELQAGWLMFLALGAGEVNSESDATIMAYIAVQDIFDNLDPKYRFIP